MFLFLSSWKHQKAQYFLPPWYVVNVRVHISGVRNVRFSNVFREIKIEHREEKGYMEMYQQQMLQQLISDISPY